MKPLKDTLVKEPDEDQELAQEGAILVDFQRVYPIPRKGKQYNYQGFIDHACELEDKLLKGGPIVQVRSPGF